MIACGFCKLILINHLIIRDQSCKINRWLQINKTSGQSSVDQIIRNHWLQINNLRWILLQLLFPKFLLLLALSFVQCCYHCDWGLYYPLYETDQGAYTSPNKPFPQKRARNIRLSCETCIDNYVCVRITWLQNHIVTLLVFNCDTFTLNKRANKQKQILNN